MTREEAINRLKYKKVYVGKHSEKIQDTLFKLGYRWFHGRKISYINKPFILISDCEYLSYSHNMVEFNSSE